MYETADCVSNAPRYVCEKGTSELMVIFADRKWSSSRFTLSSVKRTFYRSRSRQASFCSDPLMGGRGNMSWGEYDLLLPDRLPG